MAFRTPRRVSASSRTTSRRSSSRPEEILSMPSWAAKPSCSFAGTCLSAAMSTAIFAIDTAGEKVAVPYATLSLAGSGLSRSRSRVSDRPESTASLCAAQSLGSTITSGAASLSVRQEFLVAGSPGRTTVSTSRESFSPIPRNHIRVVIYLAGRHNAICTETITAARSGKRRHRQSLRLSARPGLPRSILAAIKRHSSPVSPATRSRESSLLDDGERWPVPFKDNAFVVASAQSRLAGESGRLQLKGRVVAIQM